MTPSSKQVKALADFLEFCNIKRLRTFITLKELQMLLSVGEDEKQDIICLYRLLEELDSKR